MAGGPFFPHHVYYQAAGNVYPDVYAGAGGNASSHEEGHGVVASLGTTSVVELHWVLPNPLPTGQLNLVIDQWASATSGAAKFNPEWADVAPGSSNSAATLNSETGNPFTITRTAADITQQLKIPLSSSVPVAGDTLVMALQLVTTGWTLAVNSVFQAYLQWI